MRKLTIVLFLIFFSCSDENRTGLLKGEPYMTYFSGSIGDAKFTMELDISDRYSVYGSFSEVGKTGYEWLEGKISNDSVLTLNVRKDLESEKSMGVFDCVIINGKEIRGSWFSPDSAIQKSVDFDLDPKYENNAAEFSESEGEEKELTGFMKLLVGSSLSIAGIIVMYWLRRIKYF